MGGVPLVCLTESDIELLCYVSRNDGMHVIMGGEIGRGGKCCCTAQYINHESSNQLYPNVLNSFGCWILTRKNLMVMIALVD